MFIGQRYLRPKRNFMLAISLISLVGVTLGVGVLTATVAIMKGHSQMMKDSVLGVEPYLHVNNGGNVIYEWYDLFTELQEQPDVLDAVPFSLGQVLLYHEGKVQVVKIQSLPFQYPEDHEGTPIYDRLAGLIAKDDDGNPMGRFDLSDDYVILGRSLAEKLGIQVGDSVAFHSLANGKEMLDALNEETEFDNVILPADLEVVGIFESGWQVIDNSLVFIPLERGQTFYRMGSGIHGIALHTEDPFAVRKVQSNLFPVVEPPLNVVTWMERSGVLQLTGQMEMIIFFFLFIIMVVAGFSIMNTTITLTTQKRREIGLFKALGARIDQITGVFLAHGVVVAVCGTLLGMFLAFIFLACRMKFLEVVRTLTGRDIYNFEVYHTYQLHAELTMVDLVLIAVGAFLACGFAALIPAYRAARLDSARALRNESIL